METGKYVKNTVKGTVTGAADTIKRGVGEGVFEVAEAVKVRGGQKREPRRLQRIGGAVY